MLERRAARLLEVADDDPTEMRVARALAAAVRRHDDHGRWHGTWESVEVPKAATFVRWGHTVWFAAASKPFDSSWHSAKRALSSDFRGAVLIPIEALLDLLAPHAADLKRDLGAFVQAAAAGVGTMLDAYVEVVLAQLEPLYELRDQDVRRILAANPHLIPVLREIARVVPDYFGPDVRLGLEVVYDPEDGGEGALFAVIRTSLAPGIAFERLRAFDEDWWLEELRRIGGGLTVTLEYA
jgi:hypothetical protein